MLTFRTEILVWNLLSNFINHLWVYILYTSDKLRSVNTDLNPEKWQPYQVFYFPNRNLPDETKSKTVLPSNKRKFFKSFWISKQEPAIRFVWVKCITGLPFWIHSSSCEEGLGVLGLRAAAMCCPTFDPLTLFGNKKKKKRKILWILQPLMWLIWPNFYLSKTKQLKFEQIENLFSSKESYPEIQDSFCVRIQLQKTKFWRIFA